MTTEKTKDAFKDSPYSLLFDYRSLETRFDADEARVASLLRQIEEIRSRQEAYVQDQHRIVARLAPAFERLKNPVKWREGFQDFAVTHDPDCDFLTYTPLMEAGDLDAKHLGDLADSMLAESDQAALLKAFRDDDPNDDTGEHAPVEGDAALAVVNQAAS